MGKSKQQIPLIQVELISIKEVKLMIGLTENTIYNYSKDIDSDFPAMYKLNTNFRSPSKWNKYAILDWIASKQVSKEQKQAIN